MRRVSVMRVSMLALCCALFAVGCSDKKGPPPAPPPREVEVLKLAPSQVRETGEYLGSLLSRQSVNVLPQVAGYVRKIHVKPGDKVKVGDTLLEIDARQEFAALDSAQAQRNSASARLEQAKSAKQRTEALYKEGLVSAAELERAQADLSTAEATVREASAAVSQRSVQLQYRAVQAAIPGTVGDVLVRVGDYVNANTQLTSIAQADVLELSVAVPSQRAREINVQTPVEVLDDQGKVIVATHVFFVAPEADPRTQLVEVKAVFENSVGLRPSELVRTRLVYSTRDAIQIPALAVVRQSGQPFAFVVSEKDGKQIVERKPVTLGTLGETAYVVEKGLKEGDRIATSSLQMLRDGAAIIAKGQQPSAAREKSEAR